MALDPAELRRRVRAARALAAPTEAEIAARVAARAPKRTGDTSEGISTAELADRLAEHGYDGLKKDTLSAIERGVRPLRRQDLLAIAAACEIPVEFFDVDLFDSLSQFRRRPSVENRLKGLEQILALVATLSLEDLPAAQRELLDDWLRRIRSQPEEGSGGRESEGAG